MSYNYFYHVRIDAEGVTAQRGQEDKMNIELTPEELAEVRTAILDKLREVKTLLNYTIIRPVGEPTLKRWLHRKTVLSAILDQLEGDK